MRAYKACLDGQFCENTNPRGWLLCIMTHLYTNDYNHRRRWEARAGLDSPVVDKALAAASRRAALTETPAARLLAATFDEALEQALAQLPEGSRLCLLMVDVEGLGYEAVAAHLGIPVGTVRSRLSRARSRMFTLLQDFGKTRRFLR